MGGEELALARPPDRHVGQPGHGEQRAERLHQREVRGADRGRALGERHDDEHAQAEREVGRHEHREDDARSRRRGASTGLTPASRPSIAHAASSAVLTGHCARDRRHRRLSCVRGPCERRVGRAAGHVVVARRVGGRHADDRHADRLDAVLGEQLAELDDPRLEAAPQPDHEQHLVGPLGEREPVDDLGQRRRVDRSRSRRAPWRGRSAPAPSAGTGRRRSACRRRGPWPAGPRSSGRSPPPGAARPRAAPRRAPRPSRPARTSRPSVRPIEGRRRSASTRITRLPASASEAARLIAVVVLPSEADGLVTSSEREPGLPARVADSGRPQRPVGLDRRRRQPLRAQRRLGACLARDAGEDRQPQQAAQLLLAAHARVEQLEREDARPARARPRSRCSPRG